MYFLVDSAIRPLPRRLEYRGAGIEEAFVTALSWPRTPVTGPPTGHRAFAVMLLRLPPRASPVGPLRPRPGRGEPLGEAELAEHWPLLALVPLHPPQDVVEDAQ